MRGVGMERVALGAAGDHRLRVTRPAGRLSRRPWVAAVDAADAAVRALPGTSALFAALRHGWWAAGPRRAGYPVLSGWWGRIQARGRRLVAARLPEHEGAADGLRSGGTADRHGLSLGELEFRAHLRGDSAGDPAPAFGPDRRLRDDGRDVLRRRDGPTGRGTALRDTCSSGCAAM